MNDYPAVIALIITYRRLELALATIRSVKERVIYPNIGFHISDDGSGPEYVGLLQQEIGDTYSVTTTDSARDGVGTNMNLGIAACLERADLWLHLEDDWVLPGPLDLEPCVRLLMEDESVGMVRLGRLSAGLQGTTMGGADRVWWRLKPGSDTYVFSGNASLRHRRFHDKHGTYRRNLTPGQIELTYCDRFNRREGCDIVWPAWLTPQEMFQHIGDSQSYKWQMETGGLTAEQAADLFAAMEI
jgi:hypothetical protein